MKYAIVHTADIHYRHQEPEGVGTLIKTFHLDLEEQIEALPEHEFYLAIAGDLVYVGGDVDAYLSLQKELGQKLDDIGLPKGRRMIVPGNHDIDRKIVEEDVDGYQTDLTASKTSESGFNNFLRENVSKDKRFENYHIFESDFARFGTDWRPPGIGWKVNDELGVFCLNTALCSFAGHDKVDDEKQLAVYTRSLVQWCNAATTSTNILLMHHPLNHLNRWSQQELGRIIEENFTLCLCGHRHEQDLYHNRISQKALIASAPQLFTSKEDDLGYAIILIEGGNIDRIVYRQYVDGSFLNGSKFAGNNEGIVTLHSAFQRNRERLETKLKKALSAYKDQPEVFIIPKLSRKREFNDDENLLRSLIENPISTLVLAEPQFGQTCLSHHMRLEAYKAGAFCVYVDSEHTKARKVIQDIDEQLQSFEEDRENLECIIVDSWNGGIIDHINILKRINDSFPNTPMIVMLNYLGRSFCSNFEFSQLERQFSTVHLQALQRSRVRELVAQYGKKTTLPGEDAVVTKVVGDLEALNIHRTPLNCLTLLRVFEREVNEDIINRTKLIKVVLFILFTDADSFTYSTTKPDVDDCEFILGRFCKTLVEKHATSFSSAQMMRDLRAYCKEKLITVDVEAVVDILETNNILLRFGDTLEFKHRYWVFYFAATQMREDEEFRQHIFQNHNYVNFPGIIEFYTGIDGRREDAVEALLKDTNELTVKVDNKIGIAGELNPLEGVVWDPSEEVIEAIRKDVSDKVMDSNLPTDIKDRHADESYDSEAPYNQTISKFLHEYSVISLIQAIKASSRALRNSNYIGRNLKLKMVESIMEGWAEVSKVLFCLSPVLAKRGRVTYDGLDLVLDDIFKGTYFEKLKGIYLANAFNVVRQLKNDLSARKIGPLVSQVLVDDAPHMQKHFVALFLVRERPQGWNEALFEHMNLLHRNSFYLWDLFSALNEELKEGFATGTEMGRLKRLISIVVAKHKNVPRSSKASMASIPTSHVLSRANRLQIDKIIAWGKGGGMSGKQGPGAMAG